MDKESINEQEDKDEDFSYDEEENEHRFLWRKKKMTIKRQELVIRFMI